MQKIDQAVIDQSITYAAHREVIDTLYAEGRTTNEENSESMLHYTKMNVSRMNRLDRKTALLPEVEKFLQSINESQIWLVLTEGWCGDAAQILPVMNKMAESNPKIDLRIIFRDQHLEVMDAFLTNGARSIPKLLVLDSASYEVLLSWGPRPSDAQQLMLNAKEKVKTITDQVEQKAYWNEVKINLQKWYNKDKTAHTQLEIIEALQKGE
ncbi:MAG: thioredoxin family protein [Bacteroidota bacterium]